MRPGRIAVNIAKLPVLLSSVDRNKQSIGLNYQATAVPFGIQPPCPVSAP